MPLEIINPLPQALAHYENSLISVLSKVGVETVRRSSPSAEMLGLTRTGKIRRVASLIAARRETRSVPNPILILWPAFGNLDILTWPKANTQRTIVSHDPLPLRKSFASGPRAAAVGAWAQSSKSVQIVAHSQRAVDDLISMRWRVNGLVPHPFLQRPITTRRDLGRVLVAGQYKSARDLPLLKVLGLQLRAEGFEPRIVGRGWPEIDGWTIDSRFLSEDELDNELRDATVLLLPYTRVYQSGVAIRAAEWGTPAIGYSSSNVSEIFGADWAGIVEPNAVGEQWISAIRSVTALDRAGIQRRITNWKRDVVASWADYSVNQGWNEK